MLTFNRIAIRVAALLLASAIIPTVAAQEAESLAVEVRDVDDLKAVYATVRSKDVVEARVRTPGTVSKLSVSDGQQVKAGEVVALVVDDKLALQRNALDARIIALRSSTTTAKSELDRAEALRKRNVIAQARLDEVRNAYEVASNTLKAAEAERSVIETQMQEGQVLAPANGRVLRVPVTVGSVVMGGESIATIAANEFLLRLELPERHARFIKAGDPVRVGARDLAATDGSATEGRITLVYPELQNGRVVADAEVSGLGTYFVGERALAWISAGTRRAIVIPADYVVKRGGFDFVLVQRDGAAPIEVVVQLGRARPGASDVEVLAGIEAGDRLVKP